MKTMRLEEMLRGKYWYTICYIYTDLKEKSKEAFRKFSEAGLPTLLFELNWAFCVSTYATDEELAQIDYPLPDDSYAGQVRVYELLRTGVLIDATNFGTKSIDKIIERIREMRDQ